MVAYWEIVIFVGLGESCFALLRLLVLLLRQDVPSPGTRDVFLIFFLDVFCGALSKPIRRLLPTLCSSTAEQGPLAAGLQPGAAPAGSA